MAKLIYSALASLDGYVEDADGKFDWATPSEEVHAFVNELTRPIGTHLYGRRMYETLEVWERPEAFDDPSPAMLEFATIWQAAEKIVYSSSLAEASSARTRIERRFEPEEVRELKESAERDLAVGGPNLAAQAFAAGLVDEYQLFLAPVAVGAGKRALPADLRVDLALLDQRRFENGTAYLRYRVEP